jgi:hypothetical protein
LEVIVFFLSFFISVYLLYGGFRCGVSMHVTWSDHLHPSVFPPLTFFLLLYMHMEYFMIFIPPFHPPTPKQSPILHLC